MNKTALFIAAAVVVVFGVIWTTSYRTSSPDGGLQQATPSPGVSGVASEGPGSGSGSGSGSDGQGQGGVGSPSVGGSQAESGGANAGKRRPKKYKSKAPKRRKRPGRVSVSDFDLDDLDAIKIEDDEAWNRMYQSLFDFVDDGEDIFGEDDKNRYELNSRGKGSRYQRYYRNKVSRGTFQTYWVGETKIMFDGRERDLTFGLNISYAYEPNSELTDDRSSKRAVASGLNITVLRLMKGQVTSTDASLSDTFLNSDGNFITEIGWIGMDRALLTLPLSDHRTGLLIMVSHEDPKKVLTSTTFKWRRSKKQYLRMQKYEDQFLGN